MEMPGRPGDTLASKYRVERAIGEGGIGVAARRLELGEPAVPVKATSAPNAGEPEMPEGIS